jgi:hypothetical protein
VKCAATDGKAEAEGGVCGVPDADVPDDDFNLADAGGRGSHACPGLGFAGSKGGALRMFFGMEVTGCELTTSVCKLSTISHHSPRTVSARKITYPASIRV